MKAHLPFWYLFVSSVAFSDTFGTAIPYKHGSDSGTTSCKVIKAGYLSIVSSSSLTTTVSKGSGGGHYCSFVDGAKYPGPDGQTDHILVTQDGSGKNITEAQVFEFVECNTTYHYKGSNKPSLPSGVKSSGKETVGFIRPQGQDGQLGISSTDLSQGGSAYIVKVDANQTDVDSRAWIGLPVTVTKQSSFSLFVLALAKYESKTVVSHKKYKPVQLVESSSTESSLEAFYLYFVEASTSTSTSTSGGNTIGSGGPTSGGDHGTDWEDEEGASPDGSSDSSGDHVTGGGHGWPVDGGSGSDSDNDSYGVGWKHNGGNAPNGDSDTSGSGVPGGDDSDKIWPGHGWNKGPKGKGEKGGDQTPDDDDSEDTSPSPDHPGSNKHGWGWTKGNKGPSGSSDKGGDQAPDDDDSEDTSPSPDHPGSNKHGWGWTKGNKGPSGSSGEGGDQAPDDDGSDETSSSPDNSDSGDHGSEVHKGSDKTKGWPTDDGSGSGSESDSYGAGWKHKSGKAPTGSTDTSSDQTPDNDGTDDTPTGPDDSDSGAHGSGWSHGGGKTGSGTGKDTGTGKEDGSKGGDSKNSGTDTSTGKGSQGGKKGEDDY